jgi:Cu+-exporting ATPase
MTCSSCASRIEKKISTLNGVLDARVNFGAEQVFIDLDPKKIFLAEILESIKKIGFQVLVNQKSFPIQGLTCASCVSRVEDELGKISGLLKPQNQFFL